MSRQKSLVSAFPCQLLILCLTLTVHHYNHRVTAVSAHIAHPGICSSSCRSDWPLQWIRACAKRAWMQKDPYVLRVWILIFTSYEEEGILKFPSVCFCLAGFSEAQNRGKKKSMSHIYTRLGYFHTNCYSPSVFVKLPKITVSLVYETNYG